MTETATGGASRSARPAGNPAAEDEVSLTPLVQIMARLRAPGGCPWDREQTHQSLRRYLLEETYEVLEAIDRRDPESLREELGDLLLQVVFHAQIAREHGQFDMNQVIAGICEKLRRRHPHVFGTVQVNSAEDVVHNWEEIKKSEHPDGRRTGALSGVPAALPALLRAQKLQEKAAQVGFDWQNVGGVLAKVREELAEVEQALGPAGLDGRRPPQDAAARAAIQAEAGDLLFAAVNLARFLDVDAESALREAAGRFEHRFSFMEKEAQRQDKSLSSLSPEEWDRLWEEAKAEEQAARSGRRFASAD